MTYQLGIDVGSTTVVAAVHRADGAGEVEVVPLGGGGATVPSALHLARDGGVTVGEGALRLAGIDPGRVVRALPQRIGDPAPIAVGNGTWAAEDLFARLVRWVVDRVAEREGGPAARVVLAHPALWAPPALQRLADALAGLDVPATFLAEPLAVAQAARAGSDADDTVAVYDLGGGRFDAAVVRRGAQGFALLGRPQGLAHLGGLELDDLVWQHVRAGLPEGVMPDGKVRKACLRAKETLSTKAEAVVRVRQGDLRGEVRLDRGTFEGLVAAHVDRTVEVLHRTVASAGVAPADLTAVLLVGGSSQIPLIARAVSARLDHAVTVLDDPAWVARGAALAVPVAADDVVADEVLDGAGPVLFQLPARTRAVEAVAVEPVVVEPVVAEPIAAETVVMEPVVAQTVEPQPAEPAVPDAEIDAAPDVEADAEAAPAPRAVPVRTPAVLDAATRRGPRSRSVPRLLVGAGAVATAALVVVALFRADGPLDPPLDPTAGIPRVTGAPVVPGAPAAVVPPPAEQVFPGAGLPLDSAPAAVRMTEPVRPGRSDDRPGGDRPVVERPVERAAAGDRSSAASDPDVRMTGPGPAGRNTGARADEPPVGAGTRVPPTPAPPRA